VGRERLGAGGVVRSADLRAEAVETVLDAATGLGLVAHAVTPSPLPGPSGNHEYFLWVSTPSPDGSRTDPRPVLDADAARAAVAQAVRRSAQGEAR